MLTKIENVFNTTTVFLGHEYGHDIYILCKLRPPVTSAWVASLSLMCNGLLEVVRGDWRKIFSKGNCKTFRHVASQSLPSSLMPLRTFLDKIKKP